MKLTRNFLIILSFFCHQHAQSQNRDYRIITQDAINFWQAYDQLKPGVDTTALFQTMVIDKASDAFKVFIKQWKITAKQYTAQVKALPKFYASIKSSCLRLIGNEQKIRELIGKFQQLYPRFIPADLCIGLGNFRTGGTISVSDNDTLVYIGLEFHGPDSTANTYEMNSVIRDYVSRSNFYHTIIHELVHVQQYTHGKKVIKNNHGNELAYLILKEGIPEFIALLVYPDGPKGNHFTYGELHEKELKEKLKNELWQKDYAYWIYNAAVATSTPKDLGYFMGYCIARDYYRNHESDEDVIQSIIEITDAKAFIKKSGFFKSVSEN
jgi:hypothetical protein